MGRIKGKLSAKAREALQVLAGGASVASVARLLQVSERTVYRWKKAQRLKQAEPQTPSQPPVE
jgi:transposase-like protein